MKALLRRMPFIAGPYRRIRRAAERRRAARDVARYFASASVPRLHLGCGGNLLPGWLNTDAFAVGSGTVFLDATERFPFRDGSVRFVLCEHMIEHITLKAARGMVAECRRVLAPGGVLRVSTPALERYLALYTAGESEPARGYVRHLTDDWIAPGFYAAKNYQPGPGVYDPVFVINDLFRNYEHQFLYDHRNLERLLREAGFEIVRPCRTGESIVPELRGIEAHTDPVSSALTLVLEAVAGGPSS